MSTFSSHACRALWHSSSFLISSFTSISDSTNSVPECIPERTAAIAVNGVTKRFGAIAAVDAISFNVPDDVAPAKIVYTASKPAIVVNLA